MSIYGKNSGYDTNQLIKSQTQADFKEKFLKIITSYSVDTTDAKELAAETPYKQSLLEIKKRLTNLKETVLEFFFFLPRKMDLLFELCALVQTHFYFCVIFLIHMMLIQNLIF